ncbi:hypothetical protein QR680_001026 [Steinernema hermaphroditum]|uniref:Uncharacterized protein n=1 Tax=Steinernema hermaphroditum TaxID=289476 RepID=A0AA39GXH7_9BILA|nr:hypothetical protein QR680_001026 [Steinernema hermaphroditum]
MTFSGQEEREQVGSTFFYGITFPTLVLENFKLPEALQMRASFEVTLTVAGFSLLSLKVFLRNLLVIFGDMCATAWTVMVTLYGIAAASSSFNLTSAGESSPIFLDDDLPFDNANSIERVLNLLSDEDDITNGTQLASLKVEPVEHTPKARHNESNVESIPKSIGFNGSTKLRDEVAVKRVTLGNDDLTLKLIDESVVLIINGTNDSELLEYRDGEVAPNSTIPHFTPSTQTNRARFLLPTTFLSSLICIYHFS